MDMENSLSNHFTIKITIIKVPSLTSLQINLQRNHLSTCSGCKRQDVGSRGARQQSPCWPQLSLSAMLVVPL